MWLYQLQNQLKSTNRLRTSMLHRALTSKPCMNPIGFMQTWLECPYITFPGWGAQKMYAEASPTGIISLDLLWTVPNPQWIYLQSLSLPPVPFPKGLIRSGVANVQALRGSAGLEWINSKRSDFTAMPFLCTPQTAQEHSITWAQHRTHTGRVCLNCMVPGPPGSKGSEWHCTVRDAELCCITASCVQLHLSLGILSKTICITAPLLHFPPLLLWLPEPPCFRGIQAPVTLDNREQMMLQWGGNWVAVVMQHNNKIPVCLTSITVTGLPLSLPDF